LLSNNKIWFGKTGNNVPRIKRFQSELADGLVPTNMLNHDEVGGNQFAARSLKEIFGGDKVFNYSKPHTLIGHIIKIAASKSAIVIDFFAGSWKVPISLDTILARFLIKPAVNNRRHF
jgi:adenine-specific DNA-methyltransferase